MEEPVVEPAADITAAEPIVEPAADIPAADIQEEPEKPKMNDALAGMISDDPNKQLTAEEIAAMFAAAGN